MEMEIGNKPRKFMFKFIAHWMVIRFLKKKIQIQCNELYEWFQTNTYFTILVSLNAIGNEATSNNLEQTTLSVLAAGIINRDSCQLG